MKWKNFYTILIYNLSFVRSIFFIRIDSAKRSSPYRRSPRRSRTLSWLSSRAKLYLSRNSTKTDSSWRLCRWFRFRSCRSPGWALSESCHACRSSEWSKTWGRRNACSGPWYRSPLSTGQSGSERSRPCSCILVLWRRGRSCSVSIRFCARQTCRSRLVLGTCRFARDWMMIWTRAHFRIVCKVTWI